MKREYPLDGIWKYLADEEDLGIQEKWYQHRLDGKDFWVPGTVSSNGYGQPVMISEEMTKEAVRCLREKTKYLGAAWYQTEIMIPESLENKKIGLYLERVMWESRVYLDGQFVGREDALSVSHYYDLTGLIKTGKPHLLTMRIDNRDIHQIGPNASAYTDETQTIWNGMIGKTVLLVEDVAEIKGVIIGCQKEKHLLFTDFYLSEEFKGNGVLLLRDGEREIVKSCFLCEEEKHVQLQISLPEEIIFWEENKPKLYEMEIFIKQSDVSGEMNFYWKHEIGIREFAVKDGVLQINEKPCFLRGNVDCCVYPETGYPPMDYESWYRICEITKSYGLNHIRFHSWCPPHAAFEAADRLGLYLQVEGPEWMDDWTGYAVGSKEDHYSYLPEESMRIVEEYSFHPSFCIFSNGNEMNGDFALLEQIIGQLRKRNPYLLYTLSTNWDRKASLEDDIFIAQTAGGIGIRGQYFLDELASGTGFCYEEGCSSQRIPVISHEIGQYAVYPDVCETDRYKGVLQPVNLKAIRKDLEKKELLQYMPDYVQASGHLAESLYKAEIEAALRTKGMGGFQLLGLHDFPGQSTATVGILNCFYESKGIVSPEEFRRYCNHTVLLADGLCFTHEEGDTLRFELDIANYSGLVLGESVVEISLIRAEDRRVIWKEEQRIAEIGHGLNKRVAHIETRLPGCTDRKEKLILHIKLKDTDIQNRWTLWVYRKESLKSDVREYRSFDDEVKEKLLKGENVVIYASPERIKEIGKSTFYPVFWSPVHFESQDPCGMVIHKEHVFFQKYFNALSYADFEWKAILENGCYMNIDMLKGYEPMTMAVPNFFHNHKYTNLMEMQVLNGKLLICSLFGESLMTETLGERCLKNAIEDYVHSKDFAPAQRVDAEQIRELFLE